MELNLFKDTGLHIGIDVDGVLRDFCKGLLDVIKSEYPESVSYTHLRAHET